MARDDDGRHPTANQRKRRARRSRGHSVEDDLLFGYDTLNEGAHTVYTGGERASSLQVPVIPDQPPYGEAQGQGAGQPHAYRGREGPP